MALFSRVLNKTRQQFADAADNNHDDFAALEEGLIMTDTGAGLAARLIQEVRDKDTSKPPAALLADVMAAHLRRLEASLTLDGRKPFVIMVMGINGGGKTTTIAKLCRWFVTRNKKVLLAAGDTFRAAAREQLGEWAERLDVEIITGVGDPSAVAFDAVRAGTARQCDVVLVDTAGRLPSQTHLMAELAKIRRAIGKSMPGAPHELLLVLDSTNGQNTLAQIEAFQQVAGVTGLVLTKLDGSAKGGFLLALAEKMPKPVRFVGVGEGADDLEIFDADAYALALSGMNSQYST
ncbi:signal recognition particle-docking protein FtsY [Candidatus Persebacteraceae bacterium Df01]|jgi:fused signal recognition particle receptor|uniref:Signal recognition particle-docking protein FtsY n=1 Tax=Candidatus Doriopsillibacter californiensis TaxID=2970740 RepID=A0ABT7QKV7_9GAMM|nr:signal recognition particle-docking protein FtsY [Candidatus Persebacteraceae bacterium Df01]